MNDKTHWLDEPRNVKLLWRGFLGVLALTVVAEFFVWSEFGTFDLLAATKSLDTAGKVHDCIGRLLADLVVEAVTTDPEKKDIIKQ